MGKQEREKKDEEVYKEFKKNNFVLYADVCAVWVVCDRTDCLPE